MVGELLLPVQVDFVARDQIASGNKMRLLDEVEDLRIPIRETLKEELEKRNEEEPWPTKHK